MRKCITVLLIISLLLFSNTAMARGGHDKHKHKGHKSHSVKAHDDKCGQIPPALQKAKKRANNPKARAAIQKKIDEHLKKCGEDTKSTDEQRVSTDKAELQIRFSGNDTAQNVTGALVLPVAGALGSTITWSSNKPNVVSNNGASIVRPAAVDETVILTATIRRNQAATTKSFTLIVKAIPNSLTDNQKVAADKAALGIQFTAPDTISNVTKTLASLPIKGANGSTIVWISGNPSVISNDGKLVIRPATGAGDATVPMIAIISSNSSSDTKTFQLTVKQQSTDVQKVAADKAALIIDFGGSDTAGRVTRPMDKLPTIGENGSLIVWISSSPSVISNDGKQIVRPLINTADQTVVMTALISSNGIMDSKTFTLMVKKEFTALEKLAADKADLAITFSESESATNVTKSISLPTSGYYGSTFVWISNTPAMLSNNGTLLTRPIRGAGDKAITLTAYLSNGSNVDSKTFQVVVKQLP